MKLQAQVLVGLVIFLTACGFVARAAEDAAGDLFALRIHCGSETAWTAPDGHRWEADREYEKGRWGAIEGSTADRGGIKIEGTDIEPIYRMERSGMSEYRITCPNGKYRVILHFAETYSENKKPGQRVFSVVINDKEPSEEIDPVKIAGSQFKAVVKTFETKVANGLLSLSFVGTVSGPEVNGIEVIQTEITEPPGAAQRILTGSADVPGLCVHIGCGRAASPELVAELAAGSRWLVHGLATDDAALVRARQAIDKRNVAGQAMAEKLAGGTLPYGSNLANVVVVEDFDTLSGLGLGADEALRVAVPGGVIWMERQGHWEKTVKPWPPNTDAWTHPHHGPDGNRVSTDALVHFPASLRWQDGLSAGIGGATRGVVAAGGRVFILGPNAMENVLQFRRMSDKEYLTARDVFNGLTLWKVPTGNSSEWVGYSPYNTAALVTDGRQVYLNLNQSLVALAADSGQVVRKYSVKYPSTKLLLSDGILVSVGWPDKKASQEKDLWLLHQATWAPMVSGGNFGSLQAFDAESGREKWTKEIAAQEAIISGGLLFILCQEGNPAVSETIVAFDLATGTEKWRTGHEIFAPELGVHLGVAGEGVLSVVRGRAKKTSVLAADTGKLLWEKPGIISRLVAGHLWIDGVQYEPATGNEKGTVAEFGNGWMCTPASVVGPFLLQGRANGYFKMSDDYSKVLLTDHHSSNRGGCFEGFVIAGGMILSSENNCACQTGQMPGFFALGAANAVPQKTDYESERPVERGPAFGTTSKTGKTADKLSKDQWPMLRGNAERSSFSPGASPKKLELLWQTQAVKPPGGPMAASWLAQFNSCLSAPVAADGKVFVSDLHRGALIALDAASGHLLWKVSTGGRIDGPPALWNGLCLFGSHDGWVYALRASDGALAWRTRAAPIEQRMVAFGAVESSWPVIGPVVLSDNKIFVSAGRATETDGGLALLSLSPDTGKQIWASRAENSPGFQNDLLRMNGGKLVMHTLQMDPATGTGLVTQKSPPRNGLNGWMDGSWTRIHAGRSGGLSFGSVAAELLAWDSQTLFGFSMKTKSLFALPLDKTAGSNPPVRTDYAWQTPQRNVQPGTLIRASDALIAAGTVLDYDMSSPPKGLLWIASAETGQSVSEVPLSAPPTYGGAALAGDRIYVSLEDGSVVCAGTPNKKATQ